MEKFKIIPDANSIILKRSVETKVTKKGFIIPEAVGESQALIIGTVTTMGEEDGFLFTTSYGKGIRIKEGQKVLFEKGKGTPVYIKDEEFIFIEKCYVVAIIEGYDE